MSLDLTIMYRKTNRQQNTMNFDLSYLLNIYNISGNRSGVSWAWLEAVKVYGQFYLFDAMKQNW